jgi:Domain of unknown function (DUF4148)
MNASIALSLALVATAAAVTGTARADDYMEPPPFVGTLTRAEVLAELERSRQSGINPWADNHDPLANFRSERTRDEVIGEYVKGRATVAAFNGEDSGSAFLAREPAMPQATQLASIPK